jgi:hypothetical protein
LEQEIILRKGGAIAQHQRELVPGVTADQFGSCIEFQNTSTPESGSNPSLRPILSSIKTALEIRCAERWRNRSTPIPKRSVPDAVRGRFVRVGHDFRFLSDAHAFRDHGRKLVTQTENTAVRALVDIAVERGWNDITIAGNRQA